MRNPQRDAGRIVDGNVLRVLSRIYAISKPVDIAKNMLLFWELEEKLIPEKEARYFNQGLMELGALICTAQNPSCALCPLKDHCAARKKGDPENYPVRRYRKKTVRVTATALILSRNGRYLLRRRPLGQIMGGLWEFPEWKLAKNRTLLPDQIKKRTARLVKKTFGTDLKNLKYEKTVKRNYTHHLEALYVFSGSTEKDVKLFFKERWPVIWMREKDFGKYPFSSAHAKIAESLGPLTKVF